MMLTLERKWDGRVQQWHSHVTSSAAFERLLRDLIEVAAPRLADSCVDLGAGTGFVTMALAPLTSSVLAVDISSAMTSDLAERAAQDGLGNVATQVCDLSKFDLQPASTDLVVSSYALHHLADADKRALVARAAQWLRPGGRLVIGDMMFGRGGSRRDRDILREKVAALAAKGPGGWWRIAKNLTRYGLGVGQEHPVTPEFWQAALRDAGFTDVIFRPVVAEAGIVGGTRRLPPGSPLLRNISRGTALCVRDANGQVLGGALLRAAPHTQITWLAVRSSARRRGVGHALVTEVLHRCPPPCEVLVDTFGEDNIDGRPARRLYESSGFRPAEFLPDGPEGGSRQRFRLSRHPAPPTSALE